MRNILVLLCCVLLLAVAGAAQSAPSGPPPTVGYMKIFREINDAKGKVVLVNFFATWCGPCVQEIPGLVALRKVYPEQDILMLGISMDTDYGKLRSFLQQIPVNYTVYHADAQVSQIFQVSALPKMLVYDQRGALVVNHNGFFPPEQLKQVLDGLLHENTANNNAQAPSGPQRAEAAASKQ